jgi:hypothetical protein
MLEQSLSWVGERFRRLVSPIVPIECNEEMPAPESADPSPYLQNQRLAAYEWGSGEILLSPASAFKKEQFFIRNATALQKGVIIDSAKDDLLCLIALLHEYRHFQQDHLSGFGHWDYICRTKQIISAISLAKQLSHDATFHGPLDDWVRGSIDKQVLNNLRFDEKEEIDQISQYVVEELHQPREAANVLSTRRLLEMDAVLYTLRIFLILKEQLSQVKILGKSRNTSFLPVWKTFIEKQSFFVYIILKDWSLRTLRLGTGSTVWFILCGFY